MRTHLSATAALLALTAHSCASESDSPPVSQADAAAPAPDAAVEFDAAPVRDLQETTIEVDVATCSEACGNLDVTCSSACEIQAGRASYGYYDWDYGITRIAETRTLTSCEETIPDEVPGDGETYQLAYLNCCCAVPPVTLVPGNASAPQACSGICQAAGHAGCGNFYDWQNGGANGAATGGVEMVYRRAATGSVAYYISSCATVPSLTKNSAGATRDLSSFTCACY